MVPISVRWHWNGTTVNIIFQVPTLEPYSKYREELEDPDESPWWAGASWTKRYSWWLMDYMTRDIVQCDNALGSGGARLHIVVASDANV